MAFSNSPGNRVRQRRLERQWTQGELAARAGVSRTAVTAIEGDRLTPAVSAALALAAALGTTVEALFGSPLSDDCDVWESPPLVDSLGHWTAEVNGRLVKFPASAAPMLTPLVDNEEAVSGGEFHAARSAETLVLASCDPAAGWLASLFAQTTGLRLLVLPRSGRQALAMLRNGLVHMAGLHFSTTDEPQRNAEMARQIVGDDCQLLRIAEWQEGIVSAPAAKLRSLRAATSSGLTWIGREPGSGARNCLDKIMKKGAAPARLARDHHGVVEAVRSGWADAGVCVRLPGAEAGLNFLPVQQESYDVCFRAGTADERRIKAFLGVVRSPAYRRLISALPGYDAAETGSLGAI